MRIETDYQGRELEYDDSGRCVRVRVPKLLMDAKPPDELARYREIGAAYGHYGTLTDEQRARVSDARDEYIERTSAAWQKRPAVADTPPQQAAGRTTAPDREAAYQAYCNRIQNAWRAI
jgi:hypothetical protein